MKVLQKIVLHPKLENDNRLEVKQWCESNFLPLNWCISSNYTQHGCFNVIVHGRKNAAAVTAFIMTFPEVQILYEEYDEYAIIDEVMFARNFEYT